MRELIVLRLTSHADVIGQLVEESETSFTLDGTMMLQSRFESGSTAPVVYMSRYNPYSRTWQVSFSKKDVINSFRDLTEHVQEYYYKLLREAMRPKRFEPEPVTEEELLGDVEETEETKSLMAYFEKAISNTEIH